MKRRHWRALIGSGIVLGPLLMVGGYYYEDTKQGRALNDARLLLFACESYRQEPESGGKYPTKLSEVAGRLEQGRDALIDPWGNPYRFAAVWNEQGEAETYVWSERTVNGKTTLLRMQRTTDGQYVIFGR